MKYKMLNADKYFFRKESTGAGILVIKEFGYQIFLNRTGSIIIDLLKKATNTEDVLAALCALFPSIDESTLKKDLNEILDLFDLYGLIDINRDQDKYFDCDISFGGDADYRMASRFLSNNLKKNKYNFSQVDSIKYFEPVTMRYHSFHNQEYLVIYRTNGMIQHILLVIPPNGITNVVTISGSISSKTLKEEDIIHIIKKEIDFVVAKLPDKINKIRINQISLCEKENINIVDLFGKLGFIQEAKLTKEIRDKDLIMFTKYIDGGN